MKKISYLLIVLAVLFSVTLVFVGCGKEKAEENLVFADLSWDSVQVHNRIAAFIIQNGIGNYTVEYMPGDTIPTINGVTQGDIDIDMESWHSIARDVYDKGIASGNLIDLGKNMPDAPQGWWIPRYIVEGDNAPAPDLKHIKDLPKYWKLFKDKEDPSKGIVYLGAAGWGCTKVSEGFFEEYNLGDTFNGGLPGSGAALAATMVGAYKKKQPWVGYYWAPTPILGKLDMVRLKGSEFEPADVNILVNKSMLERAPLVIEFLKKYKTSVDENNEFLGVMDDNEFDAEETALWFLKNKETVWMKWVSSDVAEKVKSALAGM